MRQNYDVVIVGGGHNGLVAACYLAKAGLSVLVLEQNIRLGGAAAGRKMFAGIEADIPEYAYLVSLFPRQIAEELVLNFSTKKRAFDSFTPYSRRGIYQGLSIGEDQVLTKESFINLTGDESEYEAFQRFSEMRRAFAGIVWPTLLEPLMSREAIKRRFRSPVEKKAWQSFVDCALGECIERFFKDDLVKGLVFTDAKIGVLTRGYDLNFVQNKTFIYHIIGGGNGKWLVPVGGTKALVGELGAAVEKLGVDALLNAKVYKIEFDKGIWAVKADVLGEGKKMEFGGRFLLADVAPKILYRLITGDNSQLKGRKVIEEGSFFKINMLVRRLPRFKALAHLQEDQHINVGFSGTIHINESCQNMEESYWDAKAGFFPENLPFEVYCHTLSDRSIFPPDLSESSCQSLSIFALDTPYSLFRNKKLTNNEAAQSCLRAFNRYLIEPLEELLLADGNGRPCLQTKSPVEVERELGMPLGNIFHRPLQWPFAEKEEEIGRWGVETEFENIFICGAGAKRGGGISGIPGRNAAMAVLEQFKTPA